MKSKSVKKSLEVNAVLNIIKQCCAIIFLLITFPYISRTLGSEGYGIYSFSWSFVSYFVMLAALGIHTYSVREGARIRDNDKKIEQFTAQVFTINLISSIISLSLLYVIALSSEKISKCILYISIQSIDIVLSLFGRDWLNSIYEDYFYITIRYIIIQFIALVAMFVLVRNSEDVWIYCVLAIFASFGGNIPNMIYTRRYANLKVTSNINLKKHLLPLFTLFANTIAMMVFVNSDIIMLGFFYDQKTVGIYSLSSKVYSMIKQMLNAIVIVALPRVTNVMARNIDDYKLLLKNIFNYLIIILLPVSCGLFMISDSVILLAGGSQYIGGNPAMKVLAVSVIFAMIGSFMMNCVLIANRKDTNCFTSTLTAATANIILNLILIKRIGIIGAAITTLAAEVINACLMTFYSKQIIKDRIINVKNLMECLIGSSGVIVVCMIANGVIENIVLRTLCAVTASIIVYVAFMLAIKNVYFRGFMVPVLNRISNIEKRRKKI